MSCVRVRIGDTVALVDLGPSEYRITTGDGQRFRFEFHHYCGPMMIGKHGEPIQSMPGKYSPFWDALHFWLKQGKQVDEDGNCIYRTEMKLVNIWKRIGKNTHFLLG